MQHPFPPSALLSAQNWVLIQPLLLQTGIWSRHFTETLLSKATDDLVAKSNHVSVFIILYSGDSQFWLQIRSTKKILMPGPHPQRAGYLLNAPQVILICHQGKEAQLDNTDSTHSFSSSAWNAWSPWHHTYCLFLFLLLFFFNIFVWSLLWFHLLCQLFIFLSTLNLRFLTISNLRI